MLIICLYKTIELQVLLFIFYIQLNCFKYCYLTLLILFIKNSYIIWCNRFNSDQLILYQCAVFACQVAICRRPSVRAQNSPFYLLKRANGHYKNWAGGWRAHGFSKRAGVKTIFFFSFLFSISLHFSFFFPFFFSPFTFFSLFFFFFLFFSLSSFLFFFFLFSLFFQRWQSGNVIFVKTIVEIHLTQLGNICPKPR